MEAEFCSLELKALVGLLLRTLTFSGILKVLFAFSYVIEAVYLCAIWMFIGLLFTRVCCQFNDDVLRASLTLATSSALSFERILSSSRDLYS